MSHAPFSMHKNLPVDSLPHGPTELATCQRSLGHRTSTPLSEYNASLVLALSNEVYYEHKFASH